MTIEYCEGKNNKNEHALRILSFPDTVNETDKPPETMFISDNADWPISFDIISKWTLRNQVSKYILQFRNLTLF